MPPNTLVISARPPTHRSTSSTPVVVVPFGSLAQVPVPNMNAAASSGMVLGSVAGGAVGSTIAFAAARFSASVVAPVIDGWCPYAATKLIRDSGCLRCWPKSDQSVYGVSCPSFVLANNCRRRLLSGGTPASRARAMLIVARSRGRPSRLLRSVSVTNSSSSLPTWSDDPMTMLPAACSGVYGVAVLLLKYSGGVRKALSSGSELSVVARVAGSSSRRATVSSSIECPKRYTACANSAGMAGLISGWYTWNGLTAGCTLRANSSKTRCWYSISVTKRAAWKSRSPFQPSGVPVASFHSASAATPDGVVSAVSTPLTYSTSRSCSEWKIWWIVVSAMFSLTRPSPAQKWASSISSSYVPGGWWAKSAEATVSASGMSTTGGVAGLLSVSTGLGSALCAMSVRNGVSKCSASSGTGTGLTVSPSTRTSSAVLGRPSGPVVTYWGSPWSGPGMNLL